MLQNQIKKSFRQFAGTGLGLRLRTLTQIRPPASYPNLAEGVSDLFVWRCNDTWATQFDLFNLVGLVNPSLQKSYEALIMVFDEAGRPMKQKRYQLAFGEAIAIDLESEFQLRGSGTFAVFHLIDNKAIFGADQTCLSERGYVSYSLKSGSTRLRSYVHGNQYCLGYNPETQKVRAVGAPPGTRLHTYQPQVDFQDAERFELIFTNPCAQAIGFRLQALGDNAKVETTLPLRIEGNGLATFDSRLLPRAPKGMRVISRLAFMRPVVFKYYATHFDVFHG